MNQGTYRPGYRYGGFELAAEQARWTVADVEDPLFDRPKKPAAAGACPSDSTRERAHSSQILGTEIPAMHGF